MTVCGVSFLVYAAWHTVANNFYLPRRKMQRCWLTDWHHDGLIYRYFGWMVMMERRSVTACSDCSAYHHISWESGAMTSFNSDSQSVFIEVDTFENNDELCNSDSGSLISMMTDSLTVVSDKSLLPTPLNFSITTQLARSATTTATLITIMNRIFDMPTRAKKWHFWEKL